MTKKYWISFIFIMVTLLGLQACGRKQEPQASCNFVQNGNSQRVSWREKLPVNLLVHASVPVEAYPAIEKAVARWNQELGKDAVKIEAWGVGGASSPARDGYNVIYWMNHWEQDKANEQARTTIYWSGTQIFEADMRINDKNYDFYMGEESRFSGVDMESLVLHELGHVLGLSHNSTQGSVMNVSLASGYPRRDLGKIDKGSLACEYF